MSQLKATKTKLVKIIGTKQVMSKNFVASFLLLFLRKKAKNAGNATKGKIFSVMDVPKKNADSNVLCLIAK